MLAAEVAIVREVHPLLDPLAILLERLKARVRQAPTLHEAGRAAVVVADVPQGGAMEALVEQAVEVAPAGLFVLAEGAPPRALRQRLEAAGGTLLLKPVSIPDLVKRLVG